eukprot:gene12691-17016_t
MSQGPSLSMIENSVNNVNIGVGNYKGVMLCNRPFAGTAATQKVANSTGKSSFTAGLVPEPLGINPVTAIKDSKLLSKKSKKESVLAKHKKWLYDLQKTKDRLETEYLDEMSRKEESQKKFQEHEAKIRKVVTGLLNSSNENKDSNEEQFNADAKFSSNERTMKEVYSKIAAAAEDKKSNSESKKAQSKSSKPAWALTENAAASAEEEYELDEVDDLIEFAKGLDFDKYIDDVEVQAMMERLRKRIVELEKEVTLEDQKEADNEARIARKALLAKMGITESAMNNGDNDTELNENNKAYLAAKALLQEDEEMQAVHSTKSMAALVKTAKEKINSISASVRQDSVPELPKVFNEPVIVTHETSEGRLDGKNFISNMPYMHRNPAV